MHPREWTGNHCLKFLKDQGGEYANYIEKFEHYRVTGIELVDATADGKEWLLDDILGNNNRAFRERLLNRVKRCMRV